jgi:hypothetical protein
MGAEPARQNAPHRPRWRCGGSTVRGRTLRRTSARASAPSRARPQPRREPPPPPPSTNRPPTVPHLVERGAAGHEDPQHQERVSAARRPQQRLSNRGAVVVCAAELRLGVPPSAAARPPGVGLIPGARLRRLVLRTGVEALTRLDATLQSTSPKRGGSGSENRASEVRRVRGPTGPEVRGVRGPRRPSPPCCTAVRWASHRPALTPSERPDRLSPHPGIRSCPSPTPGRGLERILFGLDVFIVESDLDT